MSGKYILDSNGNPVAEENSLAWGKWMQEGERIVAGTTIGNSDVSTVFLGLDRRYGEGPPLLYETLVFGGELDGEMDRYTTREEAERGHREMCERVRMSATEAKETRVCMLCERPRPVARFLTGGNICDGCVTSVDDRETRGGEGEGTFQPVVEQNSSRYICFTEE